MNSNFKLYRSRLHPKFGTVFVQPLWCLEISFELVIRDINGEYIGCDDKSFAFVGVDFVNLRKIVFSRRGEIQPYLRDAEKTAGIFGRSNLHFINGLRSVSWFEQLLSVLGDLQTYRDTGKTREPVGTQQSEITEFFEVEVDWENIPKDDVLRWTREDRARIVEVFNKRGSV